MNFEINNDLDRLVFDQHNKFHLFGEMVATVLFSFIMSPLQSFFLAYGIGIAWEIKDGIVPWWNDPKYKHYYDAGFKNWVCRNVLLSNKFSLQDALVWDLGGAIIGVIVFLGLTCLA